MSVDAKSKTLGQAIDEVIQALSGLDNDDSRSIVIKAACEHLKIKISQQTSSINDNKNIILENVNQNDQIQKTNADNKITDIKSLKNTKAPTTAVEMACVVGYYLQEIAPSDEIKQTFTSHEIDKYFRQAGFPLPKVKSQLLVDAKAAGYLDSLARGEYKLNAVGYNLVAHTLPRKNKSKKL